MFFGKTITSFPINAETPSSVSPAVTNGKVPEILSSLFNRLYITSSLRLTLPAMDTSIKKKL